jgi:serine phosphatase RsbU (regulator of sigma subunit)
VDPPTDSALLREVRHWLALAVEDLGFGVAVAEARSERILFANGYAKQVWQRLAQSDGVAGGYRGFARDGRPYSPEEWPLRRALRLGETVSHEEISVEFASGARGVLALSAGPIRNDDDDLVGAVVTMYDLTDHRRAEETLAFMAEASAVLTESERDYEHMLRRLAQLAVPRLADWCAIDLWENGMIRNVGVAHVDPAKIELAHELQKRFPPDPDSPRGVANVLRTGRSELTPEIPDALIDAATSDPDVRQILRDLGLHSAIVAPLSAHGETLGALTLISAEQRRTYTSDDLTLAEDLGHRAALSISNARLFREQIEINSALQQSLIPDTLPSLDGVEVGAVYMPAGEGSQVGGDFYDAWKLEDGAFGVAIGDVQGKGPRAAALTSLARHTMRAAALHAASPADVLRLLNDAAIRSDFKQFCTAIYLTMTPAADGFATTVAVAGHMPGMIRRRDGTIEQAGRPGTLLGMYEDVKITDHTLHLYPGDALLLFTDGVTERRDGSKQFGESRLRAVFSAAADQEAAAAARSVADAVGAFSSSPAQDDIAILVISILETDQAERVA